MAEDSQIHVDLWICIHIEWDHTLRYGTSEAQVRDRGREFAAVKPSRLLLDSACGHRCRDAPTRAYPAPSSCIATRIAGTTKSRVDRGLYVFLLHSLGVAIWAVGLLEYHSIRFHVTLSVEILYTRSFFKTVGSRW